MDAQYLAIDGSVVSVHSDAEVRPGPVTGTAWAIVPSLMRSHPFTAYPAGHSRRMVESVRENFPEVEIGAEEEVSLKGGTLHFGEVVMPQEGGGRRIVVAAWEGRHGCLTTSLPAERGGQLVEAFDTLQFSDRERGLVIDSPVVTRPRAPQLIQEIAGLGVLAVRPAVASELDSIPRAEGRRTRHAELFRLRADGRTMVLLGRGAVAHVQPFHDAADEEVAETIEGLAVEWAPRTTRRPPR